MISNSTSSQKEKDSKPYLIKKTNSKIIIKNLKKNNSLSIQRDIFSLTENISNEDSDNKNRNNSTSFSS